MVLISELLVTCSQLDCKNHHIPKSPHSTLTHWQDQISYWHTFYYNVLLQCSTYHSTLLQQSAWFFLFPSLMVLFTSLLPLPQVHTTLLLWARLLSKGTPHWGLSFCHPLLFSTQTLFLTFPSFPGREINERWILFISVDQTISLLFLHHGRTVKLDREF